MATVKPQEEPSGVVRPEVAAPAGLPEGRLVLDGDEVPSCLPFSEMPHPRMFQSPSKDSAPPERVWFP